MKLKFYNQKGEKLLETTIDEGEVKEVGRSPEVSINIPLKSISRKHAQLSFNNNQLWIKDLGSSNGIIVDGVKIADVISVYPGQKIFIGLVELSIEDELDYSTDKDQPEIISVKTEPQPRPQIQVQPQQIQVQPQQIQVQLDNNINSPSNGSVEEKKSSIKPRIIGRNFKWRGEVFNFDKDVISVGRIKGNDIEIDDKSISRKHAKFVKEGDNYFLFDLRSANGTFINKTRITKTELKGGETIRFGDIEFSYVFDDKISTDIVPGRKKWKRSRIVLIPIIVVILLIISASLYISIYVIPERNKNNSTDDSDIELRQLETVVQSRLDRAKLELKQRNWDRSISIFNQILEDDPRNEDARKGIERALAEKRWEKLYKSAERIYAVGYSLEEVKEMFAKIPVESSYYRESQVELREINKKIAQNYQDNALKACNQRKLVDCQKNLCMFFNTWPSEDQISNFNNFKNLLEKVEKILIRDKRSNITPCNINNILVSQTESDSKLAKLYPDEKIRKSIKLYIDGNSTEAVSNIEKLLKQKKAPENPERLRRIIENMKIISNANSAIYQYIQRGDLEGAVINFQAIEDGEHRLLSRDIRSKYYSDSQKLIGDAFYEKGISEFQISRYKEAFNYWIEGKKVYPDHPNILQGILDLEDKARDICSDGDSRKNSGDLKGALRFYELCRDITEEKSPRHLQALKSINEIH